MKAKPLTPSEVARAYRMLERFRKSGTAAPAEVKELALLARLWLDAERDRSRLSARLARTLGGVKRKPGHVLLQRSVHFKGGRRDIGLGPGVLAVDVVSIRNSQSAAAYVLMAERDFLSKLIEVKYTEMGEARRAVRAATRPKP